VSARAYTGEPRGLPRITAQKLEVWTRHQACNGGQTRVELARMFSVSVDTIARWLDQVEEYKRSERGLAKAGVMLAPPRAASGGAR
jgi:hypothetical protein